MSTHPQRGHRSDNGIIDSLSIVARDITDERERHDELTRLALHDPLTSLPNRRMFFECLDLAVARASRTSSSCAVLFIDLDGFKAVNDTLGHASGDALLFTVAGRLAASVRESDVLSRFGGDEFAALCEGLTAAHAEEVAVRLLERASAPVNTPTGRAEVTASVGLAFAPSGNTRPEALVRAADEAMYEAKRRGKNQHATVIADNHLGCQTNASASRPVRRLKGA
ncbi:MAG: diguanylate cyclase domain-containing protein [Acidimicrobiales bacterium]